MTIQDLPLVNATLNGLSTLWIVLGWIAIRRRRTVAHRRLMLAAVATSTLFLVSYLTYHITATALTSFPTHYPVARGIYIAILTSHTILAAATLPLVLITLWHAFKDQLPRHRRIARWTMPIWLYVSFTGVLIYFMLYQWFPA
jgi:uncharacterized membrane protein YozB (DUF420 family)